MDMWENINNTLLETSMAIWHIWQHLWEHMKCIINISRLSTFGYSILAINHQHFGKQIGKIFTNVWTFWVWSGAKLRNLINKNLDIQTLLADICFEEAGNEPCKITCSIMAWHFLIPQILKYYIQIWHDVTWYTRTLFRDLCSVETCRTLSDKAAVLTRC